MHIENQQSFFKIQAPVCHADMLLEIRERQGLTQKELADKIGAKQHQISEWEAQEHKPTLKWRTKINAAYKELRAWLSPAGEISRR